MNPLNIIYSDDWLMVLDKPAGLIVTSAETVKEKTLSDILIEQFHISIDRGGIVHRLDKDTSGIILVAKTQKSLENLQLQFKERMVKKEYLALVHGFLEGEGVVTGAIERNPRNRQKFTVTEDGKEAETRYQSIKHLAFSDQRLVEIFKEFSKNQLKKLDSKRYSNYTLVRVSPQTGRTHQIRVHLKYKGFPIVGDQKYGGRRISRLDKRWCPRQFLHAAKIVFYHPKDGKLLNFESPLPEDLKNTLNNLEKIK